MNFIGGGVVVVVLVLFVALPIAMALGYAVWVVGYTVWSVVRVFANGVRRGRGKVE
jgi:hypothetical protein